MYTGAALSFGLIRACRGGRVLYCSVLSDAGGENDGSSAIFERSLLAGRMPRLIPAHQDFLMLHGVTWPQCVKILTHCPLGDLDEILDK